MIVESFVLLTSIREASSVEEFFSFFLESIDGDFLNSVVIVVHSFWVVASGNDGLVGKADIFNNILLLCGGWRFLKVSITRLYGCNASFVSSPHFGLLLSHRRLLLRALDLFYLRRLNNIIFSGTFS